MRLISEDNKCYDYYWFAKSADPEVQSKIKLLYPNVPFDEIAIENVIAEFNFPLFISLSGIALLFSSLILAALIVNFVQIGIKRQLFKKFRLLVLFYILAIFAMLASVIYGVITFGTTLYF